MKIKVIIVDDDEGHQTLLTEYLAEFDISTTSYLNEKGVLSAIQDISPDIVILDIVLPGKDGFEILKDIRKISSIPVIMLSARGDETDRIIGLELGADDYLPKPFNPRELLARIKAVLRRYHSTDDNNKSEPPDDMIQTGGLILDRAKQRLVQNDISVELSSTEYKILVAMMSSPDKIFSRDDLMDIIHIGKVISFDRSIDIHISRMRAKIKQISGSGNQIKTVRGKGYKFIEK